MTSGLLDPLGGGEESVSRPGGNVLIGGFGGSDEERVFVLGEADPTNLSAWVLDGRAAGSGGHEVDYTGHGKYLTPPTLEATINGMTTTPAGKHRMRWFVYSGGEKLAHTATMRGHWPGWDVTCSCGWESRTGGATRGSVRFLAWSHKFENATSPEDSK